MHHPSLDELLSLYQTLAAATQQLRHTAEQQDWERFLELETAYTEITAQLPHKVVPTAPAALRPLIAQILSDQQIIEKITQARLQELRPLIHQTGQQRKLEQAYGSVAYY